MNTYTTIDVSPLISQILRKIESDIRTKVADAAAIIVEEEVAKFALTLTKMLDITDMTDRLVITIHKEIK